IQVFSLAGSVSTAGNSVQANDVAGGGAGGVVTVQAGGATSPTGDVALGTAVIEARGANSGGGGQAGGNISSRSFNGALAGTKPGGRNAGGGGGGGTAGSVILQGCGTAGPNDGVSYTGTSTPAASIQPDACGGAPTFQQYVTLPPGGCTETCQLVTPTPTST